MFTAPDDLPETALAGALQSHWEFTAVSVKYQPVGFGSHHWLATGEAGERLFVTADDLPAKRRTAQDTADGTFGRLRHAFGTALALREEAGLDFVVAPLRTVTGPAVMRLSERYSLWSIPTSPALWRAMTASSPTAVTGRRSSTC